MWQNVFAVVASLGLAALLARQFLDAMAARKAEPAGLFAEATTVLDNPRLEPFETAGVHKLTGWFDGLPVQVQAVTDTLATRKLPSLWLMVTIPKPLPAEASFDLMMRPTGPTSFSNYDLLPYAMPHAPGIPPDAIVRTDDPARVIPADVVVPHLAPFAGRRAKELLISPKGVRFVSLLAEADRARYGVFRQAAFGEVKASAEELRDILRLLIALRRDIEEWHNNRQ